MIFFLSSSRLMANCTQHGYTETIGQNIIIVLFNSKLLEEKEQWKELFTKLGPGWIPDVSGSLNRTVLILNHQRQIEAIWECDVLINIAAIYYVYITNLSIDMIQTHIQVLLNYLTKTVRFASYEVINRIGFKVFIYLSQNLNYISSNLNTNSVLNNTINSPHVFGSTTSIPTLLPHFKIKRLTKKTVLDHRLPMEYQEFRRKLYFDSNFNLLPPKQKEYNPFLSSGFQVPSNPNPTVTKDLFKFEFPMGNNLISPPTQISQPSLPSVNPFSPIKPNTFGFTSLQNPNKSELKYF